jgi:hypothetical protein
MDGLEKDVKMIIFAMEMVFVIGVMINVYVTKGLEVRQIQSYWVKILEKIVLKKYAHQGKLSLTYLQVLHKLTIRLNVQIEETAIEKRENANVFIPFQDLHVSE